MGAHLADLATSLDRNGAVLSERGQGLEQQFRAASSVAEDAQIRLHQTQGATLAHLKKLGTGAREAGEELTAVADLASARIELTLERARSGIAATNEGLEQRIAALEVLGGESDRTAGLVESLGAAITDVGQRLAALEGDATARAQRISAGLHGVSGEAERVGAALDHGNDVAASLIGRGGDVARRARFQHSRD